MGLRPGVIATIEAALNKGLPDMSLRNCHAHGVDSIMLSSDEDGCRRMFVAWSDVHSLDKLHRSDGAFQLGVHSHKYDLILHPVHGTVINYQVTLREDELDWGPTLYEHEFTSGITGTLGIGPARKRTVDRHDIIPLHPTNMGQGWILTSMVASDLHTVIVPKEDEYTAWLVAEGKHYAPSLFYSPIPEPPLPDTDMYLPMSVQDAEQVLERILQDK